MTQQISGRDEHCHVCHRRLPATTWMEARGKHILKFVERCLAGNGVCALNQGWHLSSGNNPRHRCTSR